MRGWSDSVTPQSSFSWKKNESTLLGLHIKEVYMAPFLWQLFYALLLNKPLNHIYNDIKGEVSLIDSISEY